MLSGFTHRLRRTASKVALLTFCTLLAFQAKAQFVAQNTNFPTASTGVREIDAVNTSVAWASAFDGSGGGASFTNIAVTSDGGTTWTPRVVPATSGFAFADIHAISANTAWAAMVNYSTGGGEIYRTSNGGSTWTRQSSTMFSNSASFLDALHMFSITSGIAVGDPINGDFEIYRTTNGTSWTAVSGTSIPNPLTGEYGLLGVMAGNGTSSAWFGTNLGRVYRTTNGGTSWSVSSTGLSSVNRIAFSTASKGIAVEYDTAGVFVAAVQTTDGGVTWSALNPTGSLFTSDLKAMPNNPGYYLSSSAFRNAAQGSSYSTDYGQTWTTLETGVQRTAIDAADPTVVWAGSYTSTTNTGGIFKGSLPTTPPLGTPPAWTQALKAGSGSGNDIAYGTATDATGNVYVAGHFSGTATFGSTTLTSNAGSIDGFLAKYSPSGSVLWAVKMGGTSLDQFFGVTVSANGNLYACGFVTDVGTAGTLSVGTSGRLQQSLVLRYDPATGDALWAQSGGSTLANVLPYKIASDPSGNVYSVGSYDSSGVSFNTSTLAYAGLGDAFIVSYSSTGTLRWIRTLATANQDVINGVAASSTGDIVFGGSFTGSLTIGGTPITSNGGKDGWVIGYTGTGTFRWVKSFGSTADDDINDLAMDASGNATGIGSAGGQVPFGTSVLTPEGSLNMLTFSYSSTGNERWADIIGGTSGSIGVKLTTDASGSVYVSGLFLGSATLGDGTVTSAGGIDLLVGKYSSDGVPAWVTRAGGTLDDIGWDLAATRSGSGVYVAGQYASSPVSFGTLSLTNGGSNDGFLALLGTNCTLSTPTLSSNGPICAGQQLTLTGGNVDAGTTSVIVGPNSFSTASSSGSIPSASAAASGTYILTVTLTPGCSATATTAVVVNALPSVPTVSPVTLCGPGSATLIASNAPVGGSIAWYTTSSGTVPFSTENIYTTPTLTSTTTYWVRAISAAGCRSSAVPVTVTVNGSGVPPTITLGGATEFCQGGSVVLTGGGGGPYLWSNGSTGNSITVSASGSYTVSTALNGCTLTSAPVVVAVRPLPPTPATTDASNCGPGSVTLNASGGNAGDVYNWYTAATGGAPIASGPTYTTPQLSATRVYFAELVRSGCASATRSSATANILPAATASLAAQGSTTLCPGDSVRLNATGNADTWQYYRSGSLVPSGTTRVLVVRDSGTYFVVGSQGTCTAISNSIRVNLNPAPAAAQVVPAERCGPGSVTLTASGAPSNGSYAWYTAATGGSPIVGANTGSYATPVLGANTTYYVAIVDPALNCPAPRVPVLATIKNVPTASLSATGPTTFCRGDSVKLLAGSNMIVSYQFNQSGVPLPGATGTSLVVHDSGTYTVTVTSTLNCASTSTSIRVNVNPAGDATFAYATSTLCLGGTGNVLPTISGTPGGTFSASPSGLVIDASTGAIALTGSQPNTYVVSYQVSGICPATRSQVITVTAAPSATFSYAQSSGCAGSQGTITPSFASGSSGGVFSSTTGLVIDPVSGAILLANSQPGTYTVRNTIAASGTCPGTVATASFTVNPAPATPTINSQTQGNGILLTSSAAVGNQWFLNGNPVPGATGQTLLVNDPANNGTYTVQVTANGCTSAFSAGSVVTITGIADGLGNLKLTLAPNPTTDGRTQLKLTGARSGETVVIRVLDALGRVVYTATPVAEGTETIQELNLSMLPKGLYTVRVATASRVLTQALVQE